MTADSRSRVTALRTCVGCGRKTAKEELVRVVKEGAMLKIDRSGSAPGRGAYICAEAGCVNTPRTRGRLARGLGPVADKEWERLKQELREFT